MSSPQPGGARPSRRALFPFLLLILLLAGLSAALGMAARWARDARHIPPDVPPDVSAPAVRRARQALETAERTLTAAAAAKEQGGPYRITVHERDLNTLLRTDRKAKRLFQRIHMERPRFEMQKERLRISALMRFSGQRFFVAAEGTVTPGRSGRLLFHADKTWLGTMPAPGAATKEINRRIAALLNGGLRLPGHVSAVRLEPGRLIVEGDTRRARGSGGPADDGQR